MPQKPSRNLLEAFAALKDAIINELSPLTDDMLARQFTLKVETVQWMRDKARLAPVEIRRNGILYR